MLRYQYTLSCLRCQELFLLYLKIPLPDVNYVYIIYHVIYKYYSIIYIVNYVYIICNETCCVYLVYNVIIYDILNNYVNIYVLLIMYMGCMNITKKQHA